jgi:hypothetical protein
MLKLEKIRHGFKTLAECGGIRGVDDTSSFQNYAKYGSYICIILFFSHKASLNISNYLLHFQL